MKAAAIETQVCKKCGLEKPLSEYYFSKAQNRYLPDCKACRIKYAKAYRKSHPKKRTLVRIKEEASGTRICSKCGVEKPFSEYEYRKDRNNYRGVCKKCCSTTNSEWYKKNKDVLLERNRSRNTELKRKWREDPVNREKHNKASREWLKRNRQYSNAQGAKKRAAKLQATPAWADLKKIKEIYLNCPPGHQVDHIFPLISDKMCGLHTESNLQYLPAKENMSKGNKVTLEQQLNG